MGNTSETSSVVLFSERNSPFGLRFFEELMGRRDVRVAGIVTQPKDRLCPYYLGEANAVDMENAGAAFDIPIFAPRSVNVIAAELTSLDADYYIVANYQQILARRIFELPHRFAINFHPTPLPRYAGLHPFFWMRRFNERRSGVSAIAVDELIDGGDIILQELFPLEGHESEQELRDIHFNASYRLLRRLLDRLPNLKPSEFRKQDLSKRTYFSAADYAREVGVFEDRDRKKGDASVFF